MSDCFFNVVIEGLVTPLWNIDKYGNEWISDDGILWRLITPSTPFFQSPRGDDPQTP